jgi:citrate synthase
VYRAEDPRARVLRRTAKELGAPRYEVALALEKAALAELRARRPDRVLETNVEFWAAIVLDFAEVPAHMFTSMFTCARTAGWAAHILEQKRTGRLVRPAARYTGPPSRPVSDVPGADEVLDRQGLRTAKPAGAAAAWPGPPSPGGFPAARPRYRRARAAAGRLRQ